LPFHILLTIGNEKANRSNSYDDDYNLRRYTSELRDNNGGF